MVTQIGKKLKHVSFDVFMEKDTKEISPLEWTNALENFHCTMITKPIVVEKKGRNLPRRRIITRPIHKDNLCRCKLIIHYDEKGFYIKPGQGHNLHHGHPKLIKNGFVHPSKTISSSALNLCRSLIKSHAPVTSTINVISERTDLHFD